MIKTKNLGDWGEALAKQYLKKHGYHFINQNYRAGHCEIDLIFTDEKQYVFIEVKTRIDNPESEQENPLTRWQTKNLQGALIDYSFKNHINLENTRLDLIIILANKEKKSAKIKHFQDILR